MTKLEMWQRVEKVLTHLESYVIKADHAKVKSTHVTDAIAILRSIDPVLEKEKINANTAS